MRTAIGLMGEEGYEGTSTRDIAAAAGVSVAALYHHFPSKLDLLREFLHEAHDVVNGRVAREIEVAGPRAVDRLDAAVRTLIWSNLHDDWARKAALVSWREHGRLDQTDQRLIAKKRRQLIDLVEEVVETGVADGDMATEEPRLVASAIVTLCVTVVDPFAEPQSSMAKVIASTQRLARTLAQVEPA
jgi:AcrR family transcriptional regulator